MSRMKVLAAGAKTAGQKCAICQTSIIAGEHIVYCPHCSLPFHKECWDDNGGCAQYGCPGAPATVKAEPPPMSSNAWGDEKRCPACGKTIKGQALKCRFCGADFGTREVISHVAYASREYTGADYTSVRNKIILIFLLSATGCLAPVGLILFLVLIFRGRLGKMEYRRLPSSLKAVAALGAGISGLLLLIFLLVVALDAGGG